MTLLSSVCCLLKLMANFRGNMVTFFLQAYYLMQSPETKVAGDAVGFGSAFLFACVFGMFHIFVRQFP